MFYCIAGSVDGTFKSITRLWAQLFTLMLEYHGIHIGACLGWLPNKTVQSYYIFIYLIFQAFKENADYIQQEYGVSTLRLKQIRCDFEKSIHLAFGYFHLSGCFFHFTQECCTFSFVNVIIIILGHLEKSPGGRPLESLHERCRSERFCKSPPIHSLLAS